MRFNNRKVKCVRSCFLLIFCVIIVVVIMSPFRAVAGEAWTYLVFLNDASGDAFREINELESIVQNGFIKIKVLWFNKVLGSETVYEIVNDKDMSKISSKIISTCKIDENTKVFERLADFGSHNAPGGPDLKFMITFYDRGISLENKMNRISNRSGWSIIKNLRVAFEKIKTAAGRNIDVLHFDADNFQCIELIYELGGCADYIIGSEEAVPVCGIPYATILSSAVEQKITDSRRFSFLFVSGWHNYFKRFAGSGMKATLSAVKTAELDMISEKLDTFLYYLMAALEKNEYRSIFISSIVKKVRRYRKGEFIDAFDLGRLVNEEVHEQNVEKSSREFLASLTNAVVKNSAVGDLDKITVPYTSFGASVYMPLPAPKFEGYDVLEISSRTAWEKFLSYFYSFSLAKGYLIDGQIK